MKNYKYLLFIITLVWSCNDDFLERYPESDLNGETFFSSEESMKVYNNSIYHAAGNAFRHRLFLGNYNSAFTSGYRGIFWEDIKSDNMVQNNSRTRYLEQISAGQFETRSTRTLHGWYWFQLYDINYFLENYEKAVAVLPSIRNQYAGEARLFRAAFYFDKVKRYGDVPWFDTTLNVGDTELFGARDSREMVMNNVLADINFAIEHLPARGGVDVGRVDKGVALALKSRICLHEGTFRKYHGIGSDANTWLQAAADAAKTLIDEGDYSLYTSGGTDVAYNNLFKQVDLSGNKESILYRKYVNGINGHRLSGYYRSRQLGLTKDMVDDYLCTDGKPIGLSGVFLGDDNLANELVNRDPRLRQTIVFPDGVPEAADEDWKTTYVDFPVGLRGYGSTSYVTSTGYAPHKIFDKEDQRKGFGKEENDAHIIRFGEVLLNYAEAKAELGTLLQGDLDISINLLRDRVGMPHLNVSPELDPKYASEGLSPIIVEIRRERRIELALEGFRYDDLMRWAKGEYLAKRKLGMRFDAAVAATLPEAEVKVITIDGKVYLDPYQGTIYENRVFDPAKHYYYPIPTDEIALNPALTQNPGW